MNKHKVLIVDDHPIVRQGLMQLIDRAEDMCVAGEAEDATRALEMLASVQPDVMIIDISLNHGMDGIELLKTVRKDRPGLAVLVLSMHDESCYAERVLRSGANGYLMKSEAPETVLSAIRQILEGGLYVSEPMAKRIVQKFASGATSEKTSVVDILTDRELQVFELVGKGHGTRQIAEELTLSVKTIESYYAHIKEKLSLKNSRQLVQNAVEWVAFEGAAKSQPALGG